MKLTTLLAAALLAAGCTGEPGPIEAAGLLNLRNEIDHAKAGAISFLLENGQTQLVAGVSESSIEFRCCEKSSGVVLKKRFASQLIGPLCRASELCVIVHGGSGELRPVSAGGDSACTGLCTDRFYESRLIDEAYSAGVLAGMQKQRQNCKDLESWRAEHSSERERPIVNGENIMGPFPMWGDE